MALRDATGAVLTRAQVLALATSETPPAEYTFTADVYEDAQYEGSTEEGRVLKWATGQTVPLDEIDETYGMPTVTAIAPANGGIAGGTAVTITGTNFVRGSQVIPGGEEETATATVTIGGVACTNVVVVDDETITCDSGAHAAGAADVIVTTPAGASAALAGGFTYA